MQRRIVAASVALVALGALGLATPAEAHQTSIKYVDVTVDGARATVRLTVAPGDVTEALGLPADARPSVSEATGPASGARVAAYVARWIALGPDDGAPCPPGAPRAHPDP